MKVLKRTEEGTVTFVLDKVTPAIANELRRVASFEVPVLAIEDVYISKNSSALYDEMIAHRLGLIPLKTDLRAYVLPSECTCKGKLCARCSVNITLKVKGPATVLASELNIKDPSVKPVFSEMPIVKLLEGQEIELHAVAVLGKGRDHAKWSAGLAYYQRYPEIEINQKELKDPSIPLKHCPTKVFELKGDKLVVKNLEDCTLCMSCSDRTQGAVKVTGIDSKYFFTFESWGQLSPEIVLSTATDIIGKKLKSAILK